MICRGITYTAATVEEMFRLLSKKKKLIMDIAWNNCHQTNLPYVQDIIQSYYEYLLKKYEHDDLLKLFNSPNFNYSTQRWMWNTAGNYNSRSKVLAGFREGKFKKERLESCELREDEHSPVDTSVEDQDHVLSTLQYVRLIRHILSTKEALELFRPKDIQIFIDYYVTPHSEGKKTTFKSISKAADIPERTVYRRLVPIKRYVKQNIQELIAIKRGNL